MSEEQARHLADKIIATWPNSAKHYIWKELLLKLDHHTADVTYRILRDGAQNTPTPGNYMLAYNNQVNRLKAQPPAQLLDRDRSSAQLIDLTEYLQRLRARAERNPEAADELKRWTRRNHPSMQQP